MSEKNTARCIAVDGEKPRHGVARRLSWRLRGVHEINRLARLERLLPDGFQPADFFPTQVSLDRVPRHHCCAVKPARFVIPSRRRVAPDFTACRIKETHPVKTRIPFQPLLPLLENQLCPKHKTPVVDGLTVNVPTLRDIYQRSMPVTTQRRSVMQRIKTPVLGQNPSM